MTDSVLPPTPPANNNEWSAARIRALEIEVAVLKAESRSIDEARRLLADQYERRLNDLNHAHEQQVARNAEYVSREVFDAWRREVDRWRWIMVGAAIAGGGTMGAIIARLLNHSP